MRRLLIWLSDHDIKGRLLATLLAISSREVWFVYAWLQKQWASIGYVPESTWVLGAFYFAMWVLLMELLLNEFERYRLMIHDAALGGSLIATAATLNSQPIHQDLSRAGVGWAPWIVFFASASFVISRVPKLRPTERAVEPGDRNRATEPEARGVLNPSLTNKKI